jgi:hypothetical protein
MQCPTCKGQKSIIASHVRYADGSGGWGVPLPCDRCDGAGEVPDEMADWIRVGIAMRDRRVNGTPYRSLHEEAKRRGLDTVTLSRMERGKIKPVPE